MDRLVIQKCRVFGYSLRKDALKMVLEWLNSKEEGLEALNMLLESIRKGCKKGSVLGVEEVVEALNGMNGNGNEHDIGLIEVYDAFGSGSVHYESSSRQYSIRKNECNFLYECESVLESGYENLLMVKNRVNRNKQFLSSSGELLGIDGLLGKEDDSLVNLLGVLCRNPSNGNEFVLEDGEGRVVLDLSESEFQSGYFCEGMIVLLVGVMRGSVFHVMSVSHPPSEKREVSMKMLREVEYLGVMRGSEKESLLLREERVNEMMVVMLSEVYLDDERVLARLSKVFEAYSKLSPAPCFVLMGEFMSPSYSVSMDGVRDLFSRLSSVIGLYPRLVREGKFIVIAGERDVGWNGVYPRSGIPRALSGGLRSVFKGYEDHLVFGSNPCRIRVLSQEVCVFRDALVDRLAKNTINSVSTEDPYACMVKTVVRQGHLLPVSRQVAPRSAALEGYLRLFPLPDVLVVSSGGREVVLEYSGCEVVNPGSFAEGRFVVYRPCRREMEF
ncbi:hypothetical protein WA577_000667, partial [Blastocystis sp. JDR]